MKIFSLVIMAFLLSGCSLFKMEDKRPDPVIIQHKTFMAYQCPPPPQVDKVNMRDVHWDVISRKELDAYIVETLLENEDWVSADAEEFLIFVSIVNMLIGDFFFGENEEVKWALTADGYAALGMNTSDILGALKQMKASAQHRQGCIDASEDIAAQANAREEAMLDETTGTN